MNAHPVISTQDLTRRFGQTTAVDSLTLDIWAGEIFGFLGHYGAGKTTTVRLLSGILMPDRGTIEVLGNSLQLDGPAFRSRIGVMTETPSLDERLSGQENLTIFADIYGVPYVEVGKRVTDLLETFELTDRTEKKAGGYSKGMKQRLALARAILHIPEILVPLITLVFWVGPAVAGLGLGTMVLVSARAQGFQDAYQMGAAVVLPLIALLVAQAAGVMYFSLGLVLILSLIIWLLDAILILVGSRTFRRGNLISRL